MESGKHGRNELLAGILLLDESAIRKRRFARRTRTNRLVGDVESWHTRLVRQILQIFDDEDD